MSDLYYNNDGTEIELGISTVSTITPPPPPKGTIFGSTDSIAGSVTSSYMAEDAKMGHVPSARVYWTGPPSPSAIPSYLLDGRIVTFSFRTNKSDNDYLDEVANGAYDSAIQGHLQSLPAGQTFYYCYWHEPESSGMSAAQYRAAYNHFVPLVKNTPNVVADVVVTSILEAYSFTSYAKINVSEFWPDQAIIDCLGIDYDGRTTEPSATSIHDFSPELAASTKFAKSVGTYRVSAPEFGEGRISTDSDGSNRTAWMEGQVANFVAAGLDYVNWYDYYQSPALVIANPSQELTYWKSLVAQSS